MYGLLTKCSVKMAGYWPSSFLCVFMYRDEVEVHKPRRRKNEANIQPSWTEQTWSIKDFLYGFWGNFACGIQRVVPSGQDGSILPTQVANHSARFGSSCPLAELIIIIPHCAMGRIRPPQALSSAHDLALPSGFHSRLGLWTSVLSLLTSSKLFWVYLAVFSPLVSRTILLLRRC